MTDTPIADSIPGRRTLQEHPVPSVITPLRAIADAIEVNPLAARLLETGVGQHLSDVDVETVWRAAVAIEAARREVPARYEQAVAGRHLPDIASDPQQPHEQLGRAVYGGPDTETIA